MVDDESCVFVVGEKTRDSELPELLLGQQADDVGDVVTSESSGIRNKKGFKLFSQFCIKLYSRKTYLIYYTMLLERTLSAKMILYK